MSETVVMLHGFAGTARHWDRVVAGLDGERYSPLPLELAAVEPPSLAGAVDLVAQTATDRFVLCGYSMGGRIALNVALSLPRRVSRLVLVSTSAGIDAADARAERLAADERLALEIEAFGVEWFITRWRQTALFAGDPAWVHAEIAQDTGRLTSEQIAATLRGYSAGALAPLWGRLAALDMPVVVLAGERDQAYRAIGERLVAAIPRARLVVAERAGHRVALELPAAVVEQIEADPRNGAP